jgi:hypothetical protein
MIDVSIEQNIPEHAWGGQVAFLQQATTMLNSLSFVERYAWFFLSPDQTDDGQNGAPLDTGSLYTASGSPTPTGVAYQPV